MTYSISADQKKAVDAALEDWSTAGKVRRLWARDAALWTGADENQWLGWLNITEDQLAHRERFDQIAADVKAARIQARAAARHGRVEPVSGSAAAFVRQNRGFPELHVLDSTDPAQIRAIWSGRSILRKTLFIVSSKSGSTLEPNIFKQYFFERVRPRRPAGSSPSPIPDRKCRK